MKRLMVLVMLMIFGVATVVSAKEDGALSQKWSVARMQGIFVSGSEPYYLLEYELPNEYDIGLIFSTCSWEEEYLDHLDYSKSEGRIWMVGGRVVLKFPKQNCLFQYRNHTGVLKPSAVLEIARIWANTTYLDGESIWQENFFVGAEVFPPSFKNFSVVFEAGLSCNGGNPFDWFNAKNWDDSWNIGFRWYPEDFLRKSKNKTTEVK